MQKVKLGLILERCGAVEEPRLEASVLPIELLLVDAVLGGAVGAGGGVLERLPHGHDLGPETHVLPAEEAVLQPLVLNLPCHHTDSSPLIASPIEDTIENMEKWKTMEQIRDPVHNPYPDLCAVVLEPGSDLLGLQTKLASKLSALDLIGVVVLLVRPARAHIHN